MEEIDYKELLRKYIEHVQSIEGTAFVGGDLNSPESDVTFSEEEVKVLNEIWDNL